MLLYKYTHLDTFRNVFRKIFRKELINEVLYHFIGGIARSRANFSSFGIELHAASRAIEMIRMIELTAESQRLVVDHSAEIAKVN